MRSTRSMIRAAQTSASFRAEGGVVPAWLSCPIVDRIVPDLCLSTGDDADLLGFAFENRPLLDMQLEISVRLERRGRFGSRDNRSPPARCHRHPLGIGSPYALSSAKTPAQTPEPIRLCPNRLPSSSVQLISSNGASVTIARSFRLRITSSPAITPSAPSNFPPLGWLSR